MKARAINRAIFAVRARSEMIGKVAGTLIAATAVVLWAANPAAVSAAISARPAFGLPDPTVGSLGFSVAVAGDTAIVGEPGVNDGTGAVDLYKLSDGKWRHQITFADPRNTSLDEFGWSVAITNTSTGVYAAVGASAGNVSYNIVYVYAFTKGKWRQQAALPDPAASNSSNFGDAVAISSTTLVVGAPCINKETGKLYVYERFGQSWIPKTSETNPTDSPREEFGQSLSIAGDNVLVGAVDAAYVYTETSHHHWYRAATFRNPGSPQDNFGWEVTLDGGTAVVGAPGGVASTVIPAPLRTGAAYVFTLRGTKWSLGSKLQAPAGATGDQFGYSVALSGNALLIGMPLYGGAGCGRAFEFDLTGSQWRRDGQFFDPACVSNSQLGFAVAQAGISQAIGAPYCNSLLGAVYLRE